MNKFIFIIIFIVCFNIVFANKALLIGDSISFGYDDYLFGYMPEYEWTRNINNTGDIYDVISMLKIRIANNENYDLLIINSGLHDLTIVNFDKKKEPYRYLVNISDYESAVAEMISLTNVLSNNCYLVTSTSVDDRYRTWSFFSRKRTVRFNKDVISYNAILMNASDNIHLIDIYPLSFMLMEHHKDRNHFDNVAYNVFGYYIYSEIKKGYNEKINVVKIK